MRTEIAGQAPREDLGIYHHFTVAIDTDNIKKVFDAVKDMAKGSQIFFKLLGFFYSGPWLKFRPFLAKILLIFKIVIQRLQNTKFGFKFEKIKQLIKLVD